MVWVARVATGLFVVALPILLVTSNIRFLAGEVRFYERGFREHDAAEATGLPLAELDRAAAEIVDYFENDADSLRIVVVADGQEEALFSNREVEHMEDVKALMRALFRANEAALAYVLTYIAGVFIWNRKGLRALAWQCLGGIGLGAALIGAVGIFVITGFDETWTRFHEILFRNDLWQLNPDTDRLIQMFPETFWEESTYVLGAMTLGEGLAIVVVSVAALALASSRSRPTASTPGAASPASGSPSEPREPAGELADDEPRAHE